MARAPISPAPRPALCATRVENGQRSYEKHQPKRYCEGLDVNPDHMGDRYDERPQEIGVALNALAMVPYQAPATRNIVGVSPRDEGVVLDEAQHPRLHDAEERHDDKSQDSSGNRYTTISFFHRSETITCQRPRSWFDGDCDEDHPQR
jgi:hypothetical protein